MYLVKVTSEFLTRLRYRTFLIHRIPNFVNSIKLPGVL